MEMISRGMDVSAFKELDMAEAMGKRERRNPLRQGFIALGVGAGVLVSYVLCHTIFTGNDQWLIYFGVVALFVGAAIIASHMMEKKEPEQEQK
jgi:general stress protein CsbA